MNESGRNHPLHILLPLLIAILSFTLLGNYFSSAKTYQATTSYLDAKEENVLSLTAVATGASFAITAIPDDVGTPIAEKFADLSDYFIAISAAILFEKYLTSIAGFTTFRILIPVAMLFLIISFFWKENALRLRQIVTKLLVFGIVFTAVVPLSTALSRTIDATYSSSIEETISEGQENTEQLNALNEQSESQSETEQSGAAQSGTVQSGTEQFGTTQSASEAQSESEEKSKNVWNAIGDTFSGAVDTAVDTMEGAAKSVGDAASSAVSSITSGAENLMGNFKETLNDMVNAIAVMIVTSCVIPLAVLFFLIWITKTLFSITLPVVPLKNGITRRAMNSAKKTSD